MRIPPQPLVKAMPPILGLLLLGGTISCAARVDAPRSLTRSAPVVSLLSGPLAFEPNVGQFESDVEYGALARGLAVALKADAAVDLTLADRGADGRLASPARVRLSFAGRDATHAHGVPHGRGPGVVNDYRGSEPEAWRLGIPSYAAVTYREVYPGVDVVYQGIDGAFEYDLRLRPDADPGVIAIAIEGASALNILPGGAVRIDTPGGALTQTLPHCYEVTDGGTRSIRARHVLLGDRTLGIDLEDHHPSRAVVIDPRIEYSTYLGGPQIDEAEAVAVDEAGIAFVAGFTVDPRTIGFTGFVTKVGGNGRRVFTSRFAGVQFASSLALDSSGVFVTGAAEAGLPTTRGAFQRRPHGGVNDAYVMKLDRATGKLLHATYLGGGESDRGLGIAVDSRGAAVVTGNTYSPDFPLLDPFQPDYGGSDDRLSFGGDAFVAKLSADLSRLVFASFAGGSGDDIGNGVATDGGGNVYLTGGTCSHDFPTRSALQPAYLGSFLGGSGDAFVLKLSSAGALRYSTFLGGHGSDEGKAVAVDRSEGIVVSGATYGDDFPATPGAFQTSASCCTGSGFVTRITPAGHLAASTYLHGGGGEEILALQVDPRGKVYVAGMTLSSDLPVVRAVRGPSPNVGVLQDAFMAILDPAMAKLRFSTYLGGEGFDMANGLAVDRRGSVYVVGYTSSANYPRTRGARYAGNGDAFLTKITF